MKGIEGVNRAMAKLEQPGSKARQKQEGFMDTLAQAIRRVDQDIKAADRAAEHFSSGANGNIHEAMIITEKAELSFRLVSAVRNKLVEAYREIMRMPL